MSSLDSHVYDVIGIGFGPANVAIAGALLDKSSLPNAIQPNDVLFIEKHDQFRWHPGMLLPDARMQISFLKDLATLRCPTSPLTFTSYLHDQGRLVSFINRGSTIPTRKEYSDYLTWASEYVQHRGIRVAYGQDVVALDKGPDGTVQVRSTNLSTGEQLVRRARDLIISPGGSPRVPPALASISPNPFLLHTSVYLYRMPPILSKLTARSAEQRPLRIAVIGSGQSAAEVLLDLHNRLSVIDTAGRGKHQLDMIIRNGSLKPSDDSPFANEIFDPDSTDVMFKLPSAHARKHVRTEYQSTNYGVVSPHTLENLYEIMYDQRIDDAVEKRTNRANMSTHPRITIKPYSELLTAELVDPADATESQVNLVFQNTLSRDMYEATYDAVISATGYDRRSWLSLLTSSPVGKYYGLSSVSGEIHLASTTELSEDKRSLAFQAINTNTNTHTSDTSTSSAVSSPPSSPGGSVGVRTPPVSQKLYVSRNYQLLPVSPSGDVVDAPLDDFKARVYLQGCTEDTHGLSDTLLSIVGVKCGELVEDIYAGRSRT
ncbi:hypothetical protein SERLA73DRAFT_189745 [Serpula lacrymans var. lacrymans S7.3]|uniref:L-ornithine N(5)-monooxygenase [NAD(P)H] n=2 Tax=Serpula lacrymans var. lacrymans TaxID=341189 RepID=F8QEI4_SERL3|nr:uncharacterized protein SERLADRAFT_480822 [Serpula lacrymans var. lacrymans S7.9]EGN93240.1 hypothetical protein SERLA73DRAFT_189745 [Serpula lacrymans var. lacrymans S7.3]EGO18626.1 hypothetical protein SERLADRAFT_480822 [Serpula lacrymans var. lacrymans S7.9]